MRPMEHTTTSQPPAADPRLPQAAGDDTNEQDRPQIRSLTMPGLAKGPLLPEWLRRPFRRTDTPASR
jgi:hypothetical protein